MDIAAVYQEPTDEEIKTLLVEKFGDKVEVTGVKTRRVYLNVKDRADIHDVCEFFHANLTFEHCSTVIGVDMIDHFNVVYHLNNYFTGCVAEIVVEIPEADPHILSISDIWVGANWHERETYELFGIIFDGHPDLRRLLTPDTYEFYPFRKSYKLRGQE
jgi:NADH-quinone oxidoreductase subunit C